WVHNVFHDQPIRLGSQAAVLLPENGSAGLLQVESDTLPMEGMVHKERQMVAIGAKLVEEKGVQHTLGEIQINEASTASVLSNCAKNVSSAYNKCLNWAAKFWSLEPTEEELSYELNTDFDISKMSAQERAQLIAEWQAKAITFEEMRDNLCRTGIAYQNIETAKAQLATEDPTFGLVNPEEEEEDDA